MAKIALVVLDTLRKDTFDEFFDWLPGTYFASAYSTSNWTAPAHASLFTGYYPSEVGVTAKSRTLNTTAPVLPEVLQEQGYRTEGLSANPNVSSKHDFDRGFDEFADPTELRNPEGENTLHPEKYAGESDATGVKLYLEAIRECLFGDVDTIPSLKLGVGQVLGHRPWQKSVADDGASTVVDRITASTPAADQFTFVNLMEAHTPYDPPGRFNSVGEPVGVDMQAIADGVDDPEKVTRAYADAGRYLSAVYAELFDVLVDEYDYVITLSDHGEMLGEHEMWNHTYGLYPQLTNVPLVVTDCDEDEGRDVVDEPVSLLDVHETILQIAGLSSEARGRDLRRGVEPVDRLVEFHGLIRSAKESLRESGVDDEQVRRFDRPFRGIVTESGGYAVADEDHPHSASTAETERIRELVDGFREPTTGDSPRPDEVGSTTESQLEHLGYI